MPLFGSSKKSPAEMMKSLKDALNILEKEPPGSKKADKAVEEVSKQFGAMKNILQGSGDQEPQTELVAQLAQEFYTSDVFKDIIYHLSKLDFESKKDAAQIFNSILRRQIGTRSPTVEYISAENEILFSLIEGYDTPEIALNCGVMLRECIKHEPLAKLILQDDRFYKFYVYVELSTFDIASDAFSTFKEPTCSIMELLTVYRRSENALENEEVTSLHDLLNGLSWFSLCANLRTLNQRRNKELLTRHKILCAEFLDKNYDKFFAKYKKLLYSENYVTRRQSLKLLGELLLDRHNFTVMTRYISNPENLKLMMNMLRNKSRNIQFEAFHVFKVFVANPNKSPAILDILLKNKDKLVEFLTNFHTDRTEDEQFNDEKTYLIKQIKELHPA